MAGKERRAFGPSKAMYKQMKMKPGYEVLYRDKIILTVFFFLTWKASKEF